MGAMTMDEIRQDLQDRIDKSGHKLETVALWGGCSERDLRAFLSGQGVLAGKVLRQLSVFLAAPDKEQPQEGQAKDVSLLGQLEIAKVITDDQKAILRDFAKAHQYIWDTQDHKAPPPPDGLGLNFDDKQDLELKAKYDSIRLEIGKDFNDMISVTLERTHKRVSFGWLPACAEIIRPHYPMMRL